MKLLFYQWEAFMQRDMELCLDNMGIEYHVYRFPFKEKNDPDVLKNEIRKEIRADRYDVVFSINYRDEIAVCAYEAGITYISWIVDSPFGITQNDEIMKLPTNRIFVFDGRDCDELKNRGIDTVHHMELAVNTDRLDDLVLTDEDHQRFDADISFVGKLYTSSYTGFRSRITEEQNLVIEDIIETQQSVQGDYLLDKLTLDENLLKSLQLTLEGEYHGHDVFFHEGLQTVIAREVTRRDRLMLLLYLSELFGNVALYTDRSDPLLTKVDDRGIVESFEELFKVYKATKINLNITFRRIATGIPLRVMEVLGAGGFLLTNYQKEVVETFRPGVDIVVYESLSDAAEKVKYYLSHEDERLRIAASGHVAVRRFSYEAQFGRMLDLM